MENIISRAPFGHTPNDSGSGLQPLLAAYTPPLRIAMKGRGPFIHPPELLSLYAGSLKLSFSGEFLSNYRPSQEAPCCARTMSSK